MCVCTCMRVFAIFANLHALKTIFRYCRVVIKYFFVVNMCFCVYLCVSV